MKNVLEYVNKNSDYVSVYNDKIKFFVENISNWEYNYWMSDLKEYLDEKKCIIFAFICESINFCFWGNKNNDDNNYENYIGSEELFHNLKQSIKNDSSILEIDKLINLTESEFISMIGSEFIELPLLQERYKMLKDTISIIYNKKENLYKELFSIRNDLEMLDYITQNFWHFDDKSLYKNEVIKFNKRATLLVNDLYQLSDTIKNNLKSLDNLSGCADYAVPRLLCEYGILSYNEKLLEIITSNVLIEHNSDMEIEIRANTLYALELIKDALKEKDIYLNSIEIDNIIWSMRTSEEHNLPVHKTITIYY